MGIFSGAPAAQEPDPLDDTADFVLTARQEHLQQMTETRRRTKILADQIWGSLAAYARTLKYEERRGRRRSP